MSEIIHIKAEFIIEKNNLEEYKRLINEMSISVMANEPDTINYQFFLSEDETVCMVHETYKDSQAALHHNDGVAPKVLLPQIFKIAKLNRLDVYGTPNQDLKRILLGINYRAFSLIAGFRRLK
jgi:quinol monooxygenase YgiN